MNQKAEKRFYSCCGAFDGQVVPYTFVEWWLRNGTHHPANIGITHEEAIENDISDYLAYLTHGNFSTAYFNTFRDHVDKLHSSQRSDFDFLPGSPHLGFWSFQEWAQRTTGWYKEKSYPDLSEHTLHRKIMDHYAQGPLTSSPEDLARFIYHRESGPGGAKHVRYHLQSLTWSKFNLCGRNH